MLGNVSWRSAGGLSRDLSTLMELQLNKVSYSVYVCCGCVSRHFYKLPFIIISFQWHSNLYNSCLLVSYCICILSYNYELSDSM